MKNRNKSEYTMDQELQTDLLASSRRALLHMQQLACAAGAWRTLRLHSPSGSAFLHEMIS